jgi:very-short-patch-repair endonuclease
MTGKSIQTSQIASEDPVLKHAAAILRHDQTATESIIWDQLKGRRLQGLRFRRQHVLHGYILDFYCHEKSLCIELDGAPHLEPAQKVKDQLRDEDLKARGYKVLRLMNKEAKFDLEKFRQQVLEACQ